MFNTTLLLFFAVSNEIILVCHKHQIYWIQHVYIETSVFIVFLFLRIPVYFVHLVKYVQTIQKVNLYTGPC